MIKNMDRTVYHKELNPAKSIGHKNFYLIFTNLNSLLQSIIVYNNKCFVS